MNRYLLSAASVAVAAVLASAASAVPLVLPSDGTPVVFNADGSKGQVVTDGNGVVSVDAGVNYSFGTVTGTGSLSQTGLGNLILGSNNSFTNLGINAGTVTLGGCCSPAGAGSIALNSDATIGVGGPGSSFSYADVYIPVFTTGNGLVNVVDPDGYLYLANEVAGPGSISNVGPGTLYLDGENSFVNLGINNGTVSLGSDTAAGVGSIALNTDATLTTFTDSITLANGIITTGNGLIDVYGDTPIGCCGYYQIMTINGDVTGPGSISKIGGGYLVLNGDNSFVNLGINQGTVVVGSDTAAGSGAIAINDNATLSIRVPTPYDYGEGEGEGGEEFALLAVAAFAETEGLTISLDNVITTTANGIVDAGNFGDTFILNGEINGEGSISQVGGGNLVLNGDNSFTNLGINNGTVTLGSNTAAGIGSIAINDNATLAAGADGLVIENDVVTTANGIVDAGPAGNVFTLNGDIFGPGSISQVGAGNLVLNGDNSFTNLGINQGTVTLGSDTAGGNGSIAINDNATLAAGVDGLVIENDIQTTASGIIDSGDGTFTLAGDITDVGGITKTGNGTLVLTGDNTYAGNTVVADGTLNIAGTTSVTTVFVNSGATLGGTGTVGAINVLSGGIVAPGNSIGTLNVAGAFNQASGSIYAAELASTGQSDLIIASGAATLASGATVNVIKTDASRFVLGTRYNILRSGVGVTGTYTLTGATRVSQFISVFASYDPKNVYLNVGQTSSFVSAAGTINQAAAASGVDRPGNGALYQAIAYLPDAASAQNAFDQVSGELHASLLGETFEDSRFVREAIYNHTADQFMPGMGMWVAGFGSWGAAQEDGNAARLDRSIGGFFLGFDALKTDTASVGVMTGYSTANITVDDRNSFASTDDLYVGLYGNYDVAGFSLSGAVTNTWRWVGTRRTINFLGYQDSVSADYSINTFQVFAEAAYQFRFDGFGIEPFASFAYVSVSADSFAEFGGAAALTSNDDSGSDYWTTLLGVRASYGLPIKGDTFSLTASGGWRYVFEGETVPQTTMRFASGPDFTVFGAPIAQNAFAATFSISTKLTDRADMDIGYSGQYGDGWNDTGVRAALRLRF